MTNTLITGANKGLGYETARQLIERGHTVWLGARDAERGQLAADELGAWFVILDVTNDESVAEAVRVVGSAGGGLDVLVNNAGIAGGFVPVLETTAEQVSRVFDTNVFGLVRVTQAFLPLLAASEAPVIVNVGSGMGSLAITTDPDRFEHSLTGLAYPASKAAVSMLTSQYAKALPNVRINVVDPGYTATDLNGRRGTQTVAEGAEAIVALADLRGTTAGGPTGSFRDRSGIVPW
jgi:NAD(P)-dependent dehydrogenase (short-subunit alcohol dehydrogenase family)